VKSMRGDLHVLTGGYALDALSQQEQETFERHLAHCGSCETEVRGLRETAARLAMAKALRPPPQLQARVMAATYRTRQLPPPVTDRARPGERWRRTPRLLIAASAASMAAALTLGVTQLHTQHPTPGISAAVSRVEQAPDARIQTMRTSVGGTVTLVVSLRLKDAVVTATGLPPAAQDCVYQLWVIGPGSARPAGFVTTRSVLASGIVPGDRIGITVEPAGGTARPTTTPVVLIPILTSEHFGHWS
jgi:anti-sigma-K factor RskA